MVSQLFLCTGLVHIVASSVQAPNTMGNFIIMIKTIMMAEMMTFLLLLLLLLLMITMIVKTGPTSPPSQFKLTCSSKLFDLHRWG